MKKEIILKHLGYVLLLDAVLLIVSFLISLYHNETSSIALLFSGFICVVFGVLPLIFVEGSESLKFAEGLAIVVAGWVITCVVGMLPYLMWGGEFTLANAWFESVSGFTTTGSTVLYDIESLPKGILFWRSSTHWIGGIGVILFVLLVLPKSKSSRMTIYNAEISALSKIKFRYKTRKIVQVLAVVYLGLTLAETIMLMVFGMSLFDAVNHAFATIATGGFSTKNLSIASFDNVAIEIVIMTFMVLSGIHFGLIYGTILLKKENLFRSSLVRAFLGIMLIGIVLITAKLYFAGEYSIWQALRYAAFQVISLGTTTGFATVDTIHWPIFTQIVLIYFTIQCAMTGSTSGGLKFDRVYIFFKSIKRQILLLRHPQGVFPIRIDDDIISSELEAQTMVYIALYIFTFFISALMLTAMNIDAMTAFSASIATIGNVGPGFADVSSLGNFASLPDFGKFILTINMLFGRLEIFNILALIMLGSK